MFTLLLLSALAGVALSGRSPNADFIERVFEVPGARYSTDILIDAKLDVPGLVARYGYPIEIHEVTTADGYILTMHRIPHGKERNNEPDANKPVVFIMHGLVSSSADFLVLGPGNALGYYLAEEGYDVWLGNARGNFYSRRHLNLNPDNFLNQAFWRFSWDQIGNYDLPAFVDYILAKTVQPKLHYIGHSQGGTAFLVLNSLRPEYNEKFISFQGMAPASFFTHNNKAVFRSLAPLETVLETTAFAMGMGEVFPNMDFVEWFVRNYCLEASVFEPMCGGLSITGSSDYVNETMQPVFFGHAPAGSSIRQISHFGQNIRFDTFRRFNHNRLTNILQYGSATPPDYNLSRITVPAYIYYATMDSLVYPKDVLKLCGKLPNLVLCHRIPSETFGHLDFIWGNGVRTLLYKKILDQMRESEDKYL
ncbi:unnamed protein product [Chilo suppressalis]|uniref:Lipase n=1 Tax=Chilo suppressalis TaxID=168631 RepID=A0ABN8EC98_CHISP|nr:unnamed protein product [Chilo suppressalis]